MDKSPDNAAIVNVSRSSSRRSEKKFFDIDIVEKQIVCGYKTFSALLSTRTICAIKVVKMLSTH